MGNSPLPISIAFLSAVENTTDDNVDVEVVLSNGEVRTATFFTVSNILSLMKLYQETGECLDGLFFWSKEMIIVKDLEYETVRRTIWELVKSGEYRHAMGVAHSTHLPST